MDEDKALCPKCLCLTEEGNDGFFCLKCQILFNVCSNCHDSTLMHLKAWGLVHNDESSENFDENYENFRYTHNDKENPKYIATEDDDEALTDHSMYLWYCPKCKVEIHTIAD